MKPSFILLAFLFCACATNFKVAGPYARTLSESDIVALKQLAESGHYHSVTIKTLAPDRVTMETLRTVGNETRHDFLDALRRHGKWRLVKRPDLPPSQKPLLLY
jgi:hypothetical protein